MTSFPPQGSGGGSVDLSGGGLNSTAVSGGSNATASGSGSTAVGDSSVASSTNSTAVGFGAGAITGSGATCVGRSSGAEGADATCVGASALAANDGSVALGGSSNADADGAISLGVEADNSSANTLVIGSSSYPINSPDIYHGTRGREDIRTGTWRRVAELRRSGTSPQSITVNTNTALTWDTETFDERGWVDLGTNNDRVTFDGSYTVRVTLDNINTATGSDHLYAWPVQLASGGTPVSSTPIEEGQVTVRSTAVNQVNVFNVSSGDFIYVEVTQNSGTVNWPGTSTKTPRLFVDVLQ